MALVNTVSHEGRFGFQHLGHLDTAQAALGVSDRDSKKVEGLGEGVVVVWDLEQKAQSGPVGHLRFSTDADGDAWVIDVMAQWGKGTDYVRIVTLTLTGGKQLVGNSTRTWVDSIAISNEYFEGQLDVVAHGKDMIARLHGDLSNVSKLAFHATTIESDATLRIEGEVMGPRSWWKYGT